MYNVIFYVARANRYNAEEPFIRNRRRANSSLSTVSMSNVPAFMSAGQLLSPGGLSATTKLFENAGSNVPAEIYALRGEQYNVGLGISNMDIHAGLVEQDDLYEYCHAEESGGILLEEGKEEEEKRKWDEKAIDEADSSDEDEDDEAVGQGGAKLDVPSPFPKFGTMSPINPLVSGTLN